MSTSQSTSGPYKVTHVAKVACSCTTCGATIAAGEQFYRYTAQGASQFGDRYVRRECAACVEKRNARHLEIEAARKAAREEERTSALYRRRFQ